MKLRLKFEIIFGNIRSCYYTVLFKIQSHKRLFKQNTILLRRLNYDYL